MLTRGGELTVFYHGFSTQEDLDEQYNLWESVPDFLPRLRYEHQRESPTSTELLRARSAVLKPEALKRQVAP